MRPGGLEFCMTASDLALRRSWWQVSEEVSGKSAYIPAPAVSVGTMDDDRKS